jgi:phosphoglucosamine mutase
VTQRLFGTDGVRGLANGLLTAELATSLGVAAAQVLTNRNTVSSRPFAVVGRDPRASGEFLQAAVSAGLASAGVDVIEVGVVPTPAVAFLTTRLGASLGVVISASHNPMPDNGIKFFDAQGMKLDDAVEDAIERSIGKHSDLPTGSDVGRIRTDHDSVEKYVEHIVDSSPVRLDGLTVVIDAANGSASVCSPEAFRRLGARVIAIHCEPDGININHQCGSTHMSDLVEAVKANQADIGFAHDGDADRCLTVTAEGDVIDGDQILAMLAIGLNKRGALTDNHVVATVMSNLGFTLAMQAAGIEVTTTAVGDRYVLEEMRASGRNLGGEQSGHIVMLDYATTGDGVLTAVQVAALVAQSGESLAQLASVVTRLPQVLVNVPGVDKSLVETQVVQDAVALATRELNSTGRVLLRPSGTEPLIRVMVEAATDQQAREIADRLAAVVRDNCGLDSKR